MRRAWLARFAVVAVLAVVGGGLALWKYRSLHAAGALEGFEPAEAVEVVAAATVRWGPTASLSGTVIALQKGPESDEFVLTFDVLGSHSNVRLDPVPLAPAAPEAPASGFALLDGLSSLDPQASVKVRTKGKRARKRMGVSMPQNGRNLPVPDSPTPGSPFTSSRFPVPRSPVPQG